MSELILGDLDPNRNFSEKDILGAVCAINAFATMGGAARAARNGLALGDALQRFSYDVLANASPYDREFSFDIAKIDVPCLTKKGTKQSPALATFCRHAGLIDDSNGGFALSELGRALLKKTITPQEYVFMMLTKQGVYVDGEYKDKLLVCLAKFLVSGNLIPSNLDEAKSIVKDAVSKYLGVYGFDNEPRVDLLLNAMRMAGLLQLKPSLDNLQVSDRGRCILEEILKHRARFSKTPFDSSSKYVYLRDVRTGILEIVDVCNTQLLYSCYPGLKALITATNQLPPLSINSLQLITYGAPGTGKSYTIDKCTNESNSIRVTFHPDTDYSAFVGAYKPTVDEQERYALDATGQTHKIEAKEKTIAYTFVPQAFMKAYVEAWRRYTDAGLHGDAKTYYLVIEEINRGNCAQVFGDLFQLLDRADNGFSAYAISPDDDIQKFLEKDKDYKLVDIPLSEDIKKLTESGEKVIATAADIKTGKKLVLPPNLCIWATMNTSDQSLFPIDSAFKRRWDWEYVPIENAEKGWKIDVNGVKYIWWSFLEKINDVIATETSSEDKQLGYFFVKAKGDVIDAKTFVSKVIFYLWGDVFKDNLPDEDAFKYTFKKDDKDEKRLIRFADFFHPEGDNTKEQWRDKLLTSFLDALEVEKDLSTSSTTGSSNAPGQGSSTTDGGVATANE